MTKGMSKTKMKAFWGAKSDESSFMTGYILKDFLSLSFLCSIFSSTFTFLYICPSDTAGSSDGIREKLYLPESKGSVSIY